MPKNAVWTGVRRLCHAAKRKKEHKGSGAYMNQAQRFSRGISDLVVEYTVAIDVTRVQFPADAHCSHESVRAGETAWTRMQLTCTFCRRHFGRAAKASAC